jgi:type II secretory pathway component PulF
VERVTDLASLYRGLAALHRAGIPWPEAVRTASGGDPRFAPVADALGRGTDPATAFAPVLDPLDVARLRAGSQGGALDRVLSEMAQDHESEARRRRERRAAAAYPVLLAHVAAVLLAVPDVLAGRPLQGLLWTVAVLSPVYVLAWLSRHRLVAWGPWRSALEEADARALEALGHLHDAGVPLPETLDLASRAGAGGRVAHDLERARLRVARGQDLAGAWSEIPPGLALRLSTGERAGALGDAARGAASELRFAVEMRRKRLAAVLPPLLILAVGLVIAWRVISFWSGLYGGLGRH